MSQTAAPRGLCGVKYRMSKPALLRVKYRNSTGGDTGEIAISQTCVLTSEEKGEQGVSGLKGASSTASPACLLDTAIARPVP